MTDGLVLSTERNVSCRLAAWASVGSCSTWTSPLARGALAPWAQLVSESEVLRRLVSVKSWRGEPLKPTGAVCLLISCTQRGVRFYNILSVNFHAQSEHTFRGKRFPLELHLVRRCLAHGGAAANTHPQGRGAYLRRQRGEPES